MGRLLLALAALSLACGGAASGAASAPRVPPDPPELTRLAGYRSEVVSEPVFGGTAYLVQAGDPAARTVVLVHGLGDGGARDFYSVLPRLAEHHHVVAFDLPGFGRSTHGTELYSPESYARFVHEVVRPRLHVPFALLGHSLGGAVALRYAARYPEDVARLALVDVAGILHREAFVQLAVEAGVEQFFAPARGVAGAVTSILVSRAPSPEALLQSDLARRHLLGDAKKIAAAALIVENFGPDLDGVRAPTWVLWGRHDPVAPLRTAFLLRARLPRVHLEILEGSAHVPMDTEPARLADLLLDWLDGPPRVESGPPATVPRAGRCEQQTGMRFEGHYAELELVGCSGVELYSVRTAALRVRDSKVSMVESRVVSTGVALTVSGSRIELTGCELAGEIAIEADRSELDIAGTRLTGRSAAVQAQGATRIVFSASRLQSQRGQGYVHEVRALERGDSL